MNVVFYRPYADIWFKNPARRILHKQRMPNKYEEFFDYFASRGMAAVSTSLHCRDGWRGWIDFLGDALRLIFWMALNRINPLKVRCVLTRKQFEEMDAAVFVHYGCFTHENLDLARQGEQLAKKFAHSQVKKIVHLTHYLYNPCIGAKNLEILRPDLLIAENDLRSNSPYFARFFGKVPGDFYHLPYVAAKRFQRKNAFNARTNKLGVTGSITYKLNDSEFVQFFGQSELQPLRRALYQQQERIAGQIDCLIYDLDESRQVLADATLAEAAVQAIQAEMAAKQRAYYETDIVEFFNQHTMFAVPEEICNLPGIGFIEGMACGTAYFGIDDPMYREIGMQPGVHYVTYDGTVDGLLATVAYYQTRPTELAQIAECGYRFAREQMSAQRVYAALQARIAALSSGI